MEEKNKNCYHQCSFIYTFFYYLMLGVLYLCHKVNQKQKFLFNINNYFILCSFSFIRCFFLWFFSFLFPQRGKLLFFSSFVFFSSPKGSLPPRRGLFPGGKQKEGRNSPSGTFSFSFGFVCLWQKVGIKKRRETNETEANEPEEEIKRKSPLRGVKLQENKRKKQKEGGRSSGFNIN